MIDEKNEFSVKFPKVKQLFTDVLAFYNEKYCQCAYPRFRQLAGINCSGSDYSFKCFETELLIDLSKVYFDVEKSELNDEVKNEKWICKKCRSAYEYGWSDFSLYVERQKLRLSNFQAKEVGKPVFVPIPLYLGLYGHSYPPMSEMKPVDYEEFEKYISEQV